MIETRYHKTKTGREVKGQEISTRCHMLFKYNLAFYFTNVDTRDLRIVIFTLTKLYNQPYWRSICSQEEERHMQEKYREPQQDAICCPTCAFPLDVEFVEFYPLIVSKFAVVSEFSDWHAYLHS